MQEKSTLLEDRQVHLELLLKSEFLWDNCKAEWSLVDLVSASFAGEKIELG